MILLLVFAASLELTVTETAGIRRFGYPVKVRLAVMDLAGTEKFRLLDGKKPMAAQFRPDGKRAVWLDFNLSTAPLDKKTLMVEYGPDVESGPEGKEGPGVKEEKGTFVVRQGPTYAVPADLGGLLAAVGSGKAEYVKPGSKGLWVETEKGRRQPVSGLKGVIARQGPLASALAFTGKVGETDIVATLTFPRSKSWVEVEVMAPGGKAIGADLKLDFASPGLVDFGAGTGVYVALKKGQTATMEAMAYVRPRGHWWSTFVDGTPYVMGRRSAAEGWAHAMDRTRCTAVAVEDFGGVTGAKDQIAVDADGGLRLTRNRHRLRFWLHFVPMPPHVGAVTSPQSMMNPLQVEVKTP